MEYRAKVKLSKVTCLLCKRTFNNYFHWHDHMRQEHESVFRKLSDGRISSSFEQYYTLADEEQNFAEPSSNLQVENGQSIPVTQNGTNVSTSPQNGSDLQVDKEESLPVIQNGTNVSTSPQNEALGAAATSQDLNAAEQTSFDQTSGTSLESHTIFSSGQRAMTHNPDLHAEASRDPMNEPSTSYQQAENRPPPGLFYWNRESLSPEVETSVPGSEDSVKKPSFFEYLKSIDTEQPFEFPPFNEKDDGRFILEPPPKPVDLSGKLRAISAVKNSRVPEKPCAKKLFSMLPVLDPLTGAAVLIPHPIEVQSTTPYKDHDQWIQGPSESPIEIADRILARGSHSNELDEEMSTSEDPDEGNTVSDEGSTVSDEGNAVSDEGNAVSDEGNAVSDEGNAVSDEGNAVSDEGNVWLDVVNFNF